MGAGTPGLLLYETGALKVNHWGLFAKSILFPVVVFHPVIVGSHQLAHCCLHLRRTWSSVCHVKLVFAIRKAIGSSPDETLA